MFISLITVVFSTVAVSEKDPKALSSSVPTELVSSGSGTAVMS